MMDWPLCGYWIDDYRKSRLKAIQHHLWGGHNVDVVKSHVFAAKIDEGKLTEEDKAEINQLSLPMTKAQPR